MKPLIGPEFNLYRVAVPQILRDMNPGASQDEINGCFVFARPSGNLRVIAASGDGWDHISVSLANRCPTWDEMEWVKRRFFEDNEVAMQLHVAVKDHINVNPFVLHLWRPLKQVIPLPPKIMV